MLNSYKLRDILRKNGITNQCPLTAGRPTTTVKEWWDKSCKAMQNKKTEGRSNYKRPCDFCKGEVIPDEVTFVSKEEMLSQYQPENKKKGNTMSSNTRTGICEICEKEKDSVRAHFKKERCQQCSMGTTLAKSNPEAAVALLREFHGDKYFNVAVVDDQISLAAFKEILSDTLSLEKECSGEEIAQAIHNLIGDIELLKQTNINIQEQNQRLKESNKICQELINEKSEEIKALENELSDIEKQPIESTETPELLPLLEQAGCGSPVSIHIESAKFLIQG